MENVKMKKQLLVITLLLSMNAILQASTTEQARRNQRPNMPEPTAIREFKFSNPNEPVIEGLPKNSRPIGGSPYAVTPTESRNFEFERAQHEELVRNVQEILTIVRELRDRK
jgi:hypothetical protein